jgi:hypothetical protein
MSSARESLDRLSAPPQHASYLRHRREFMLQVILPVLLAALLLVALIALLGMAAVGGGGDLSRWAAISTIWIVMPVLAAGVFVLLALIGLIYLLGLALHVLPTYTGIAQDYVYRAEAIVKRITAAIVEPVYIAGGLSAYFKALFGRK